MTPSYLAEAFDAINRQRLRAREMTDAEPESYARRFDALTKRHLVMRDRPTAAPGNIEG